MRIMAKKKEEKKDQHLLQPLNTKISMVPLEILVVIPKAWKKEVFSGPSPVFWAGTVTSQGAMAPARAAAGTWEKPQNRATFRKQAEKKNWHSIVSETIRLWQSQDHARDSEETAYCLQGERQYSTTQLHCNLSCTGSCL